MLWGTFGAVHIVSLLISAAIIVGLYFLLKNRSEKVQRITLFVLSFSGIVAILYNLLKWNSPLEYLPFHMCSINALILPIAVITKNKVLGNLLLVWCIGALLALVVNFAQANYEIFSMTFVIYFFPHTLEFGIPILLFAFGLVKFKPKYVLTTVALTFVIYTGVHFINLALNEYCLANNILNPSGNLVQVNYMYSITPANPVLDLFWSWLPFPYWYMYFGLIIIAVYEGVLCLCWYLKRRKKTE